MSQVGDFSEIATRSQERRTGRQTVGDFSKIATKSSSENWPTNWPTMRTREIPAAAILASQTNSFVRAGKFMKRFIAVTTLIVTAGLSAEEPRVDFSRQILPILSNKCFICHGPDARDESDLRLDSFEGAAADRGGYRAIDPDDPGKSEMLVRLQSADDPMPPEDAEKQLTPAERDLLTRWVREGGEYAKHWAFIPPKKEEGIPQLPSIIDWYIGKGLKEQAIDFAPPADRATLARRLALVLTGLPPTQEQLKRFLSGEGEKAYAELVDQLLASSRFGEHQARYWLDAVRYGDTHGLHLDNRRGIYPYRDWVVGALNQNLPLNDFITWQLAGDLLPNPTLAQQVATGYVRLNPSTGEGGAIPAEFQMKNNFDRVETLGTVFLGLSLTCARCHTHKYDPIPQSEYYSLLAFFNSTAEPSMDGNSYTYGPVARVPDDQAGWRQWQELESARDKVLAAAGDSIGNLQEVVDYAQARSNWRTENWRIAGPVALDDPPPKQWTKAAGLPGSISGRQAKGKLPGEGQAVWVAFKVKVPADQHLQLAFSGAAGSQVMVDRANVPIAQKHNHDPTSIKAIRLGKGEHEVQVIVHGRQGMSELEVRVENPWDALAKTSSWQACSRDQRLRMLADAEGPFGDLPVQKEAAGLAVKITAAQTRFTTSLIARDLSNPRETRLLKRGEYDLPVGDPLQPGVLSVLGQLPADAPRNRIGLARWLTSPEHPLVARVLVNRIWQRTFGYGLVRTPEDFGLQGQQPTHPELLDWLAVELQESGWNLKQMLRLMVMSKTFQQASVWRADVDDPENRLFARGASYRLDAEVLRDVGLWAGGILDPHMGGEGVKPYQPVGMWLALAHPASNTKNYVRDKGQRLYRRSLYVYWKRTSPHPMMTLFDAPDRESSCVRRSRTNTSLQSLGLLNEIQRVEMARKLAERLLKEQPSDDARIDHLFQLLACRTATKVEKSACRALVQWMRERYTTSPQDAAALLSVGDLPHDTSLPAAEVAAWTQVAITVLASDMALLMY